MVIIAQKAKGWPNGHWGLTTCDYINFWETEIIYVKDRVLNMLPLSYT